MSVKHCIPVSVQLQSSTALLWEALVEEMGLNVFSLKQRLYEGTVTTYLF